MGEDKTLSAKTKESSQVFDNEGFVPSIEDVEDVISVQPDPVALIESFFSANNECLIREDETLKWRLRFFVESLPFRIFTLLCILADISIVIADIVTDKTFFTSTNASSALDHNSTVVQIDLYEALDLGFSSYFMLELSLRICSLGVRQFVDSWQNILDIAVVLVTWSLSVSNFILASTSVAHKFKLFYAFRIIRIVRIVRLFRLITEKRHLETGVRHLVSGNKRRYQKDGFDLDLTYVTDRVIAMSFPSTGRMSLYRNPMKEVVRFLDTKHPDCYKVYNLCSEEMYDPEYFHGRVERYEIKDHSVPSIQQMLDFTRSVKAWLEKSPSNVVAVHCKGGKGRTGTMIGIWLVETGLFRRAEDSLDYYGFRRTDWRFGRAFQGVETPSQSRYVEYYEEIKHNQGLLPAKRFLKWRKVTFEGISRFGRGDGSDLILEVASCDQQQPIFRADLGTFTNCITVPKESDDAVVCWILNSPLFEGDVRILVRCRSSRVPKGYEKAAFYFWFNTAFVKGHKLKLKKEELDNLHKPKSRRYFPDNFAVELDFNG